MKTIGRVFADLFNPQKAEMSKRSELRVARQWSRARSRALTPAHAEEIDGLFTSFR